MLLYVIWFELHVTYCIDWHVQTPEIVCMNSASAFCLLERTIFTKETWHWKARIQNRFSTKTLAWETHCKLLLINIIQLFFCLSFSVKRHVGCCTSSGWLCLVLRNVFIATLNDQHFIAGPQIPKEFDPSLDWAMEETDRVRRNGLFEQSNFFNRSSNTNKI